MGIGDFMTASYGMMPVGNGRPVPLTFGAANAGSSNSVCSTSQSQDSYTPTERKKKGNPVCQFVKGLFVGAKNAIFGAFSLQGLATIVGVGAAIWLTGGAILPLMLIGGMALSAYKAGKAFRDGDYEKAGEATFDLGIVGFGALGSGFASFKSAESSYGLITKSQQTLVRATGPWDAFVANIRSVFGGELAKLNKDGQILHDSEGNLAEEKTIYQLLNEKVRGLFGNKVETDTEAATEASVVDKPSELSLGLDAAQQQGELIRQGVGAKYTIILTGQNEKPKEGK